MGWEIDGVRKEILRRVRVGIKRAHSEVGIIPRIVAFRLVAVGIFGTVVGSLVPESGSILAYNMGISSHIFNPFFLTIGILGVSLALFFGYKQSG